MADEKKGLKGFEDLGAVEVKTEPPPEQQQAAPGLTAAYKEVYAAPAASAVKSAAETTYNFFTDVLKGAGTGFLTSAPAIAATYMGYDPSKVQVPGVYQTVNGEKKPATLKSLATPPDTAGGTIGDIIGTTEQLLVPELAAAKIASLPAMAGAMPKLQALAARSPQWVRKVAGPLAGNVVSSAQEYGKTGEAKEAVKSTGYGTATELALGKAGQLFSKYRPAMTKYLAEKSLAMEGYGKEFYKKHEELVNRIIETGSVFTKKGVEKIEDRFQGIVYAMKNASARADDLLQKLHKYDPKLLPEEGLRMVEVTTEGLKKIEDLRQRLTDASMKDKVDKIFTDIMKIMPEEAKKHPTVALTFQEAEHYKELFNEALREFYDKVQGTAEDNLVKSVKKEFTDGIRTAQQKAFNELKYLKSKFGSKIPPGSAAAKLEPWKATISGKDYSYSELGKLANKDADLIDYGWINVSAMKPQAEKSQFNEMAAAIAAAQFMHASLLTPSQSATAWNLLKRPQFTSSMSMRLNPAFARATNLPPGLAPSKIAGKTVTATTAPRPISPSAESLLSEPDVKIMSPGYFNETFKDKR